MIYFHGTFTHREIHFLLVRTREPRIIHREANSVAEFSIEFLFLQESEHRCRSVAMYGFESKVYSHKARNIQILLKQIQTKYLFIFLRLLVFGPILFIHTVRISFSLGKLHILNPCVDKFPQTSTIHLGMSILQSRLQKLD